MRNRRIWMAVLFSAFVSMANAAEIPKPPVILEYITPEKFTDISSTYLGPPNSAYLDQLRKHVMKRAIAYLGPGEQLMLEITDIDMAGGFEPWVSPVNPDIRMVRDIYPPRIEFNYQLHDASGGLVKEGKERLTNLAYLLNPLPNTTDTMRYEKALFDGWLRKELSRRDAQQKSGGK